MSILHTVNKTPFERNSLQRCLSMASDGSSVLLIEDGALGAVAGTNMESEVRDAVGRLKIFVLGPDLAARGMDEARVIEGISVVGYGGFVDLAAEHSTVQAWL